jgi:hypothetical protein
VTPIFSTQPDQFVAIAHILHTVILYRFFVVTSRRVIIFFSPATCTLLSAGIDVVVRATIADVLVVNEPHGYSHSEVIHTFLVPTSVLILTSVFAGIDTSNSPSNVSTVVHGTSLTIATTEALDKSKLSSSI